MTDFGVCYNSTGSTCSGGPQPGMVALRDVVLQIFPKLGSLGIYNCRPSSGGGGLSTHGEGRGWDCRCNAFDSAQLAMGNRLAELLIKNHRKLGIQRIIWNTREWDCKEAKWEDYGGQSPHKDHLHIELCWRAARGTDALTRSYVWMVLKGEDEMTPAQEAKLDRMLKQQASLNKRVTELEPKVQAIWKALYLDHDQDPGTPAKEHLNLIDDKCDQILAAVT